jgi:hypothetical protein
MGVTVKVACGDDKVHVGETRARKDGSEIQGEVDVHEQSVHVGRCGDSARWGRRCARGAALMYEVVHGTPSGGWMARHHGVVAASGESSAVAAG